MLHTIQYQVNENDELFSYLDTNAHLANNLYNETLFRIRQMLTVFKKKTPTENEQFVLDEIRNALPQMNTIRTRAKGKKSKPKPFLMPDEKHNLLSYNFLDALFKVTDNKNYNSALAKQSAQHVIRQVTKDTKAFFKAIKSYKKNPAVFTGKPKLPKYKKSGSVASVVYTNQGCKVKKGFLLFPCTKLKFYIGNSINCKSNTIDIRQVVVIPFYKGYKICLTYDDGISMPDKSKTHERIAAIDLGVNNIAAIANNIGIPGLLFKGGIIKSANQWFNKKRAKIVHGITVGHETKSDPTSKSLDRLSRKREGLLKTELYTIAKQIIAWCIENKIDTLVVGRNKGWKQNVNLGHQNNQAFVNIPFYKFQRRLSELCDLKGIHYIEQNEDYTSQASCLDGDTIPTDTEENPCFSGKRIKRGLYRSSKGLLINADINGAANILRKAFPDAYNNRPNLNYMQIVT